MMRAIREDRTPNLLAIQYTAEFKIANLFLIPRFFITESVVEKRPPLGPSARRAGWVGCNILLARIPMDGRIAIVEEGIVADQAAVRKAFEHSAVLRSLPVNKRGWTVDVLNVVRSLKRREFSLADVYAFEEHLSALHLSNRNIRPKIRQQLQVLRDLGFLEFLGAGQYRALA